MIIDKSELGPLATFLPNKHLPVYNWFYYKEGFSRDLVTHLLEIFKPKNVLDPFCGVGTTTLDCKESGISSAGTDVSPLACFAARVKCGNFPVNDLENSLKTLQQQRFFPSRETVPKELRKFYPPRILEDLLFFRQAVSALPAREFFQLALIAASSRCSFIYRDGAVLKVVRRPLPPFRHYYFRLLKRMINEYSEMSSQKEFLPTETTIQSADARKLPFDDETFDAVITSPPYLNKIEYQSVYWPEEQLFFGGHNRPVLRSFIGQNAETDEFPELNQSSAKAYFTDMKKVLAELYRVCRSGANLAFVIGNACFPDGVVDCDTILSELAGSLGFQAGDIWSVNTRWCTRNRVEKIGRVRESIVFLKK